MKRPSLLLLPLAALGLLACGDSGPSDRPASFHLNIAPTAASTGAAKVDVTVYGYDIGPDTASGSKVFTRQLDVGALPATVEVVLPPELAASIDDGATFSVRVNVDKDGDGQICPGGDLTDLESIAERAGFVATHVAPGGTVDVPVEPVVAGRACGPAFPG